MTIVATSPAMTRALYMGLLWANYINHSLLHGPLKYVAAVVFLFGIATTAYKAIKWGDLARLVEYFFVAVFVLLLCSRWTVDINTASVTFWGDIRKYTAGSFEPEGAPAFRLSSSASDVPAVEMILAYVASRMNYDIARFLGRVSQEGQAFFSHPLMKTRAALLGIISTYNFPPKLATQLNGFVNDCYTPALQDPANRSKVADGNAYPRELDYGNRRVELDYPDGTKETVACQDLYDRLAPEVAAHMESFIMKSFNSQGVFVGLSNLASLTVENLINGARTGFSTGSAQKIFLDNLLMRGDYRGSVAWLVGKGIVLGGAVAAPEVAGATAVGGALAEGLASPTGFISGFAKGIKDFLGTLLSPVRKAAEWVGAGFNWTFVVPVIRDVAVMLQAILLAFLMAMFPLVVILALFPGEWDRVVSWFFLVLGLFLWSTGWAFVDLLTEGVLGAGSLHASFVAVLGLGVAYLMVPVFVAMILSGAKTVVGEGLKGAAAGGSTAGGIVASLAGRGGMALGG